MGWHSDMLTALAFIAVNCLGYFLALIRGPFWALLVYANIYFNAPDPRVNWWAEMLSFRNWSYLTTGVVLASMFLHRDKLSDRPIKTLHLVVYFLGLTTLLTYTASRFPQISQTYLVFMVSYTIICVAIVKIIKYEWQLKALWLWFLILTANLSLNAYLHGKRIHGRLENIGAADSLSSNLFGLLLAGVIPFLIPFLCSGKRYERIVCFLTLPFILNALVLCNSRGALVALAGGFVAAFFFLSDRQIRKSMAAVGILLVGLFIYLADQELVDRISSLLQASEALQDDQQANALSSGRMQIWGYGMQMVGDHPFGAGPGGFKLLAREYMPSEILTIHAEGETGVRGAHNSYLLVMVEQGPLGLLLWLSLCTGTLLDIRRASVKLKSISGADPFWKYAVFSMGVSLVASLLGGLFTSRVYYEFFWWQIAMVVVLSSLVSAYARETGAVALDPATDSAKP